VKPGKRGKPDAKRGKSAVAFFDTVAAGDVAEIRVAVADDCLAGMVEEVTGGRVHPEIVAPAGLHAIRTLAAYVQQQDPDASPGEALGRVLRVIQEQIGAKGRQLNSLKLIGLRIAGDAYTHASSLAAAHFDELRTADKARVLAPHLFGSGKGALTALIDEFGAEATLSALKAGLALAMVNGMAVGSVRTWIYFRPALVEQRRLEQMQAAGLRPGDVFGAHKR
jgi:hypothetical protein